MRKQLLFATALICSASLAQAGYNDLSGGIEGGGIDGTAYTLIGLEDDAPSFGGDDVMAGLYLANDSTNLYIGIAGSLNGNSYNLFIDTPAVSGVSEVATDTGNAYGEFDDLATGANGLMPAGFDVDYVLNIKGSSDTGLWTIGGNGDYKGNNGGPAAGYNMAIDSSATEANPLNFATLSTGYELQIPLADLGLVIGDSISIFGIHGNENKGANPATYMSNHHVPSTSFGGNLGNDGAGGAGGDGMSYDGSNGLTIVPGSYTLAAAPAAATTVSVDAAGVADGTTIFNTIQAAIDSYSSGGTNAGATAPFTVNVVAANGPYVGTINLDDADAGNGDIQGDLIIQSSVPGTLVDVRVTGTGDDGIYIYQNTANVTFTDLIISPELAGGVTDDLVKIDKNSDSAANLITFNNCIITDVADAGGPLTSTLSGPFTAPAAFTGNLATSTDCLMKVWGDAAEYMNIVINDSLFYGANCRAIQFGTIATAGTLTDYTLDINNTTFAYTGSPTTATIDFQGGGAQPKVMSIDGSTFIGSRYHTIFPVSQNANIHEINVTNTIFSDGATRVFSGDDNTNLNMDGVIIHQATAQPAIVYGGWDSAAWNNVTIHSAGSNAILTVDGGAANTLTVRDSIFSGSGTTLGGGSAITSLDIDDSAIVQDGIVAVTAVGAPTGLTLGANITDLDPAYVDAANGDFDVQNTAYAGAGSAASDLSGGAAYLGGVAPAAVDLSGVAAALSFGSVQSGNSSAAQQINVANTGGASTTITSALTGTDAADFTALFGATASVVVAGGGNEDIDVTFSPASTGVKTASLALDGLSATGAPSATALDGTSTANVGDWNMLDN